jgi:uncharacterized membrane protein YedE/YeeE
MLGFKSYICVCLFFFFSLVNFLILFCGVFFISCFSIMVREGTSGNGRRGGGVKSTKNEDAKKTRNLKIMNENERNAQVNTI